MAPVMPSTPSLQVVHKGTATCPACAQPLEDAVTATCGHDFCRLCLFPPSQMGSQPSGRILLCPVCQEEEEQTENVMTPVPLGPLGETCCEEHGEKIYFFCENDAEFLCVFCREGPAHQAHTVGLLEEAIQPYRVRSMLWSSALSGRAISWGIQRESGQRTWLLVSWKPPPMPVTPLGCQQFMASG